MQKQLEQALLVTFAIVDNFYTTLTVGRHVSKSCNDKVKNKGKLVQVLQAISRYLIHIIHNKNTLLANHTMILNIFSNLVRRYTLEDIKEDTHKVVRNMEVYHLYHTNVIIQKQTNDIHYTLEEEELWRNQTKDAIRWEETLEEKTETWNSKDLKKLRAILHAEQKTEEKEGSLWADLDDDINYIEQINQDVIP